MNTIDQHRFGKTEEQQREKSLEALYRDIGSRDIRAAAETRRSETAAAVKRDRS